MVQSSIEVATATQDSSPLDHYDFDTAIPEMAEHLSVPTHWMRSPEAVAQVRQQRQADKAQQQVTDAAPAIATIAAANIKANAPGG